MPFAFQPLEIPDIILVTPTVFPDERGHFQEVFKFCDFFKIGVRKPWAQVNRSFSKQDVVRGLHYQKKPFTQAKLIHVLKGEIFDVAVDIRHGSPSFGRWVSVVLKAEDHQMVFIPEGFAHGFLTLSPEAEIEYFCSDIYAKAHERGLAYNDPQLNISWPVKKPLLSPKDLQNPLLKNSDQDFFYEK